MPRSRMKGAGAGALAALLWSPHFYIVRRVLESGEPVNLLVFYFNVVLWAAVVCFLVLFLTGRWGELSVFKRNEGHFLVLVATGGYGFWLLRALSMQKAAGALSNVQVLFYSGPLLLGFLSVVTREAASARRIGALMLGFVGCIMIAGNPAWRAVEAGGPTGFGTSTMALLAAACWAVFALAARPMVQNEKALPVTALVLGLGAACLLVTCLTTHAGVFVGAKLLRTTILVGLISALSFACWLTCLASAPAASAAALWYLALVFGVVWASWTAGLSPGWFTLGGQLLILYAAHAATAEAAGTRMTMSGLFRS